MNIRTIVGGFVLAGAALGSFVAAAGGQAPKTGTLGPKERLGRDLFFDTSLSEPKGQSCEACHARSVGWTGPSEAANKGAGIYEGAVKGRYGNAKPPASAYAGGSPVLHADAAGNFVGGLFWDGRATGETLGDPLAEQAMGPPLNPLEQNMPDAAAIVARVRSSPHAKLFEEVWGPGSLDPKDPRAAYEKIARSIAAFERSAEVNPFSSPFDDFWRKAKAKGLDPAAVTADTVRRYDGLGLGREELDGLALFSTKARCAVCHTLAAGDGNPPVFTNYTYANLGVPRNPDNPFYRMDAKFNPEGKAWVDEGLGGTLAKSKAFAGQAAANRGKHKTPTLRNVDKRPNPGFVKAYMHNGYFKSLEEIVRFYNTRTAPGAKWPAPEVAENLDTIGTGNLGLTAKEEAALVAFMKTLSDK